LTAGRIRVRVDACGICGTDLHSLPGNAGKTVRMTGHEIAGRVSEIGPGVVGLEPGQRVVLDSSTPCGRCAACRNMRQELCEDIRSFFHLGSYGFSEEMTTPAICAIPYAGLEPATACLQEPLGVAIDLVRLAEIGPDFNVLVMGGGPIGLMAVALARHAGARRVFLSQSAARRARCALARAWGVDAIFDPRDAALTSRDFGGPIHRILVTSPPQTLADAFAVAARGAIVAFIGIAYGEGAFCRFDVNAFHFKKLQLRASFASPALFGPRALAYLREGVIDGQALVSHRFSLDAIAAAVETAKGPEAIKVVVLPGSGEQS
jgi:threonine dehydrogenase-like Zn-dependent dehydrogenase